MLYTNKDEIGKVMHNGAEICKYQQNSDRLYTKLETQLQEAGVGLALLPKRADGNEPGRNTPFTNPWIDIANKVGKNLFDYLGIIISGAVRNIPNGFNVAGSVAYKSDYIDVPNIPPGTYNISFDFIQLLTKTVVAFDIREFNAINPSYMIVSSSAVSERLNKTFTIPVGKVGFRIYMYSNVSATVLTSSCNFTNIQLELGAVATAYEPYKKNNALLVNFAGTAPDGWDNQAIISSTGVDVDYENLVVNGDFANGTIGWGTFASSLNVSNGIAKSIATAAGGGVRQPYNNLQLVKGKRLYFRGEILSDSTLSKVIAQDGTQTISGSLINTNVNSISSGIILVSMSATYIQIGTGDYRASAWTEIQSDKLSIINLTDNPVIQAIEARLGRQLTIAECDRIFPFMVSQGLSTVGIMPFLKRDGINSYDIIANNQSIDILNLDEFEIARCFMTSNVLTNGQLILKTLDGTTATAQYGTLTMSDGSLAAAIGGVSMYVVPIGTLKPNTVYVSLLTRTAGRLIHKLNGVETYNQPNTASLTSKPNFRLGARCNIANGSTHTLYSDVYDAGTLITKNPQNWDKLSKVTERAFRGYFGPAPIVLGPILKDLNGNPILDVNGNIIRTS